MSRALWLQTHFKHFLVQDPLVDRFRSFQRVILNRSPGGDYNCPVQTSFRCAMRPLCCQITRKFSDGQVNIMICCIVLCEDCRELSEVWIAVGGSRGSKLWRFIRPYQWRGLTSALLFSCAGWSKWHSKNATPQRFHNYHTQKLPDALEVRPLILSHQINQETMGEKVARLRTARFSLFTSLLIKSSSSVIRIR